MFDEVLSGWTNKKSDLYGIKSQKNELENYADWDVTDGIKSNRLFPVEIWNR